MNAAITSKTQLLFAFAICATFASTAHAQAVDTSEWVCEFCPFEAGQRMDLTAGATGASDDSAYFGDASGYDEEGVYANVDGDGSYAGEEHRLQWEVEDLGLDSRYAGLRGGQQGAYGYELSYRQLPRHRFFTSESIFQDASGNTLALPSGWVRAPLTSGFTALGANLAPRNIESERSMLALGGDYLATNRIKLSANVSHEERDGTDIYGGAYFSQSSLLPGSYDYVTDSAELGIRYLGDNAWVALLYRVSEFENDTASLGWETPFTSAAGAESAELALPPDNSFQQLSLTGNYRLANHPTVVAYSVAFGNIDQDAAFLPYTTNSTLSVGPLPRQNLAGDVDTTNLAFSLTSRILDDARLKISYRFDERDNKTAQSAWERVIADTFDSIETVSNIPYSFERSAFSLTGEYELLDTVRLSGGYDRKTVDRDFQEVAEQTEDGGWGRVRWRPNGLLQVTAEGGASKRDVDAYNESFAVSLGQNPLMRKYNLAYRYRRYGELTVIASLPETPVSITVTGLYADDNYSQSRLGLTAADDLRLAADLSWLISENVSFYLSGGYEDIESDQAGSEAFAEPDWFANVNDDFVTFGAGIRAREIAGKFGLQFDYTRSDGTSAIDMSSAVSGMSRFPDLETTLDYLRAQFSWRYSESIEFDASLRYQRFDAEDWALQGVGPATLPTVLTLGADPYDDEQLLFGIGFRYLVGGPRPQEE